MAAPFRRRVGKEEQLEMEVERISARIEVGEAVSKAALDTRHHCLCGSRGNEMWKIRKRGIPETAVAGGKGREEQQM